MKDMLSIKPSTMSMIDIDWATMCIRRTRFAGFSWRMARRKQTEGFAVRFPQRQR